MSILKKLLGRGDEPKSRVRVCIECGMPVDSSRRTGVRSCGRGSKCKPRARPRNLASPSRRPPGRCSRRRPVTGSAAARSQRLSLWAPGYQVHPSRRIREKAVLSPRRTRRRMRSTSPPAPPRLIATRRHMLSTRRRRGRPSDASIG